MHPDHILRTPATPTMPRARALAWAAAEDCKGCRGLPRAAEGCREGCRGLPRAAEGCREFLGNVAHGHNLRLPRGLPRDCRGLPRAAEWRYRAYCRATAELLPSYCRATAEMSAELPRPGLRNPALGYEYYPEQIRGSGTYPRPDTNPGVGNVSEAGFISDPRYESDPRI